TLEEFGIEFFEIYKTGKTFIIDRDDPDLSPESQRTMDSFNAKLGLFVPMVVGGRVIGSIGMDNPGERHTFTEREIELANVIAGQAAVAIENARLFDAIERSGAETRRRAKELSILNKLSNTLSQTLELDTLLNAAIDSVMDLLEADGAAIYLLDEEGQVLRLTVHRGLTDHFVENSLEIPFGERLPGAVAKSGEPLIIEDLSEYPEFEAAVVYEAFVSLVGAPIKSKGRVIGAFPIGSRRPGKFTSDDATLLESIGNEIGVAIENSRLYEAQRNISEELQRSMLPALIPSIPGIQIGVRYASATEEAVVGGDFYDIYDIDGKYALVIGDVSGKGIEAAASTSMIKYILRSYLYRNPSPSPALTEANGFVRRQAEQAAFITVFCAVYDPKLGTVTFSNAGHPYPCLLNQILKTCTVLATRDPAIGIIEDYNYSENTAVINPGDLIVAYTDGVIEARSDKEFFGEERLFNTLLSSLGLPVQKIADSIIDATLEFSHGRLTDDVAILVLKSVG
ncbi:MAG: SpoIIE family protein phosphatase, partial [Actinobacteria bacterium]|nr:SpoIIE family protein phosphatase [Actinomycetota bacterium]